MKTIVRLAAAVSVCVLFFGVSNLMAGKKGGGGSVPAPPPPVLCGCACPDGSFIITHAPDENSCDDVCASACSQTS